VEDEVGVPTFELLGERESEPPRVVPCDDGDAVPDVESFFFEDLSLSFVLDSCSCWTVVSNSDQIRSSLRINAARAGEQKPESTYHPLPKALHIETASVW
jgi:hypothetical protein